MERYDYRMEVPPEFSALDIHLATPMLSTTTYTIHTNGELCDCAQNNISANSTETDDKTTAPADSGKKTVKPVYIAVPSAAAVIAAAATVIIKKKKRA